MRRPRTTRSGRSTDQTFCREVVGCLHRADVALYVGACTDAASPLRECAAYTRVCARELARLRGVCGLNLDEHLLQTAAVQPDPAHEHRLADHVGPDPTPGATSNPPAAAAESAQKTQL